MADLIVLAGGVGIEMAAKKLDQKLMFHFLKVEEMQNKNRQI